MTLIIIKRILSPVSHPWKLLSTATRMQETRPPTLNTGHQHDLRHSVRLSNHLHRDPLNPYQLRDGLDPLQSAGNPQRATTRSSRGRSQSNPRRKNMYLVAHEMELHPNG